MTSATTITLLLAIASGLAVIAFKTPRIFLKLTLPLIGLLLIALTIVLAWNVGFQNAFVVFSKFMPPEQIDAAALAFKDGAISSDIILYIFVAGAYIGFINWLANQVIGHTKDRVPEKPVDEKKL